MHLPVACIRSVSPVIRLPHPFGSTTGWHKTRFSLIRMRQRSPPLNAVVKPRRQKPAKEPDIVPVPRRCAMRAALRRQVTAHIAGAIPAADSGG